MNEHSLEERLNILEEEYRSNFKILRNEINNIKKELEKLKKLLYSLEEDVSYMTGKIKL